MKKVDLTEGKVLSVLIKLAVPIMASSFLQFAYNILDMLWVGNLGSNAVAAIGSSSFFVSLGYSISSHIATGAVELSFSWNRRKKRNVNRLMNIFLRMF